MSLLKTSDTDHLSNECYGADKGDIMYDVFERYRVEERNPIGAGAGRYKSMTYLQEKGSQT